MGKINTYHTMIVTDKWTLLWRPLKVVEKYLQRYNRQFPLLFMFNYRDKINCVPIIVSDTFSVYPRFYTVFYIVMQHDKFHA